MEDVNKKTFWEKVKHTISSTNISKGWKIVRGVATVVFVIGGLLTGPACPIVFSTTTIWWIGATTTVSGVIAVGAQMNTGKK
jgi:hypothetical protein